LVLSDDYRINRYELHPPEVRREAAQPRGCDNKEEMTMSKTILTALGVVLIIASTVQFAAAAERHHVRKPVRATMSEQVRNANNAIAAPAALPSYYSGGYSAPAGR
jgi:hypothetical protein